jgi:hypothetical protein
MSLRVFVLLRAHRTRMPNRDWSDAEFAGGRLPLGHPQAQYMEAAFSPVR